MNSPLEFSPSGGAKASNLAFALTCLPADRRADALIFYEFCRTVDDIADDPGLPPGEKFTRLAAWLDGVSSAALPPALESLIARRSIDRELFAEIIRGVESDVDPHDFATCQDLRAYCWRVACAVGLVSIRIFGCRDSGSATYAEHLGHALQLTNILRDVAEDATLGRLYLPMEDLARFGVTREEILAARPGANFPRLMAFEAGRAREFFAAARRCLPPSDAAALAPAETMRAIYEKILRAMERGNFDVFARRYRLPAWRKLATLLLTNARLKLLPSPRATASG